jgi:hypothetical protein
VEDIRFRLYPGIDSDELSRNLKRDSTLHLSQRIGIADYRDLQCTLVNKHKDPEGLPIYTRDSVEDLQQGHSSVTAREHYALTSEDLRNTKPEMINAYRRASSWWQHITGNYDPIPLTIAFVQTNVIYLGIEPLEAPLRKQTNDSRSTGQAPELSSDRLESRIDAILQGMKNMENNIRSHVNDTMGASLAIQTRRNPRTLTSQRSEQDRFIPHPSLIRMLREFLRDPLATFKTPEQAEALNIVMAGDRHLLLVGPTAMGKSLVYMLPAAQRDQGITCVLLPLSALHLDFDRRCGNLGIDSSRWLPGTNEEPRTKIVYVSPEHAQTVAFTNYLISTSRLGLLVQFVIDEVHLVKLHSDFRFCFSALQPLVTSGKSDSFQLILYV